MNPQFDIINGKRVPNPKKIEWTDYTWNAIAGCQHGCEWDMPNGSTAICYADRDSQGGRLSKFYPDGFARHYWHENRLQEPVTHKRPEKIFPVSHGDLFGSWVPEKDVNAILDIMTRAHWHTFQTLTKAPPVMLKYNDRLPPNLWAGASIPPSIFRGKRLSQQQQERMLHAALKTLAEISTPVRWPSIEPLSWDVAPVLAQYPETIQWAVIGEASSSKTQKHQPNRSHIENVLSVLDQQNVAVFFKGNLRASQDIAFKSWRENYPTISPPNHQLSLFGGRA